MPRVWSLLLWAVAVACFIASWVTGDRRLSAAGAACLVLYIGSVMRGRTGPPRPRQTG
jgi:DMSO reductase anchor subunit